MKFSGADALFPGLGANVKALGGDLGKMLKLPGGVASNPLVALWVMSQQQKAINDASNKSQIKKSALEDTKASGFDAQQDALNQLKEIAKTGQTAPSNAMRQDFLNQENTRLAGNREGILQRENMRSAGNNTGNRLVSQLMDTQNSANIGNQNALQSANLTAQNQMGALSGLGGFTGQLMGRANALDDIKKFNAANIMQAGLGTANSYGNLLQNQQFNAQMGQQQQMANQQLLGSLLGGASQGAGYALMSDERVKKDIRNADVDIEEFLDKLSPKKYKYKGTMRDKTGIMAQDVESSKAGKDIVMETPMGKAIDTREAVPVLMAAVSNLHKRLKEFQNA